VTPSHALATLAVAALALVAGAAPAGAQEVTVPDARGDVWGAADATTATPSPAIKAGDITKAVVRYEDDRAKVRIGFAKLVRKGAYAQYAVKFQGSRGNVVREVLVEAGKRDRSGVLRVFNAHGRPVERCDTGHDIDYKRDKVTITVQRGCLGKPGKVRVNVNTAYATGAGVFYTDNLHDTAAQSTAWTEWVKRTR